MGIAKRLNLVMVSAFALLLGCLMFTSLDTAWGLTYQEGDVWIGTDGEQMTPEEAGQWVYSSTESGVSLTRYAGEIVEGKIVGCVPATINDKLVNNMQSTFSNCRSLVTAPDIPDSVTTMSSTFVNCTSLVNAPVIPDGVTEMISTFGRCTSLVNAPVIPDGVTTMSSTFSGCTSLVDAPVIPDGVTNMSNTFSGCTSLVDAPVIPDGVTDMSYTFDKCESLVDAPEIPDSVTDMRGTFSGCTSLVNAPVIPDGVTTMGTTFSSCTSLVNAPVIPDGVTEMISTFGSCTSLVNAPAIPDSVTNMSGTFINCTSLVDAPVIPDGVTNMNRTFYGCTALVNAPVIPDSVRDITEAFRNCKSLTGTIFIPDTTGIGGYYTPFEGTVMPITVQYTSKNTNMVSARFPSNITKQLVESRPETTNPGEDEEQDPTTPSNPGETSGNMSIYGTVQPITMIDVTVPLTIQFIIESDRTFTGPDSIEIKSNCPSPLDVNLYGVNKDDGAPSLVAPDTHSDDEWNNLSRAETLASMALILDNTSLSSTGSTLGRIDSAFQSEKALDIDLSAKYGKAWDNSEDLVFTYNVVFEFAMP